MVRCPQAHKFHDKFASLDYNDRIQFQASFEPQICCNICKWCSLQYKLFAVNSEKKKIPDNRKRDPALEWAVTLTMPPGHKTAEEMIKAAENILNKASTNRPNPERADRWAYVLEYTSQGVPHIHGVYHTPSGRALSTKTIKYHWPLWNPSIPMGDGFQGGYHAPVRHGQSYEDYMSKEGVVIKNVCP